MHPFVPGGDRTVCHRELVAESKTAAVAPSLARVVPHGIGGARRRDHRDPGPTLVLFAGIETDKAIGASLAIIAINSAFGFLGHLREAEIDWKLTSFFVLATLPGLALGAWFSSKMSKQRLNHVFAWLVVTAAVAIAAVNLWEPVARS